MPTARKTIAVRPTDSQYELISRLCALTGKSRNSFFQEVLDNSEPALRQMLDVLDQANRYRDPGARVGKVLSVAAREVATVQGKLADELSDLSDGAPEPKAPSL